MYATAETPHTNVGAVRATRGYRTRPRTLTRTELLIALTVLAFTLCAAVLPSILATAPAATPTVAVRVADQETLWDLAKAHPVSGNTTAQTVSIIRDLNGLEGSMIAAGEVLRVPAPPSGQTALASR